MNLVITISRRFGTGAILISFVSFTFLFPPSDLFSILFQYSTNNSCMPPQVTV